MRLDLVVPAGVDDPARPSGGNTYDLRAAAALRRDGVEVVRHDVPGGWPRPDPDAEARLAAALAAVPDGAPVLVDGLVGCAAPDVLAACTGRVRVGLLVHLPLADETGLAPDDVRLLGGRERRAVRAAAGTGAVLATSRATAARVEGLHGLPRGSVRVAPPGVDPAPVTAASADGTRLLCVASVTPRKGHDVLLEALARLGDRPWRLTVAGPADEASPFVVEVRRRVVEHGWEGRVRWAGPLAGDDLAAAYAAADLLVLPSRSEPYGMVVTEALARGVPVVGSEVDGLPEALGRAPDGVRPGVLVPPGDPAALGTALAGWLEDAAHRDRLRTAALGRRAHLAGWEGTAAALAAALGLRAADAAAVRTVGPAAAAAGRGTDGSRR